MRCELSKIEDIKFIEKLIAGENLVMIGKDKAFDMRVENAQKRMESFFEKLTVEEERAKKEKIRQERESVKYTLESSSESNEVYPK